MVNLLHYSKILMIWMGSICLLGSTHLMTSMQPQEIVLTDAQAREQIIAALHAINGDISAVVEALIPVIIDQWHIADPRHTLAGLQEGLELLCATHQHRINTGRDLATPENLRQFHPELTEEQLITAHEQYLAARQEKGLEETGTCRDFASWHQAQQQRAEEPSANDQPQKDTETYQSITQTTHFNLQGATVIQIPSFHQCTQEGDFSELYGNATCGPFSLHNATLLLEHLATGIPTQHLLLSRGLAAAHIQQFTSALRRVAHDKLENMATEMGLTLPQAIQAGLTLQWHTGMHQGAANNITFEILQSFLQDAPQYDDILPIGNEFGYACINGNELLANPHVGITEFHDTYAPLAMIRRLRNGLLGATPNFYSTIIVHYAGHYWTLVITRQQDTYITYVIDSLNIDRITHAASCAIIERLLQSTGIIPIG